MRDLCWSKKTTFESAKSQPSSIAKSRQNVIPKLRQHFVGANALHIGRLAVENDFEFIDAAPKDAIVVDVGTKNAKNKTLQTTLSFLKRELSGSKRRNCAVNCCELNVHFATARVNCSR